MSAEYGEETEALVRGGGGPRQYATPPSSHRRRSPPTVLVLVGTIAAILVVVVFGGSAYSFLWGESTNTDSSASTPPQSQSMSISALGDQCHDLATLANEPLSKQDGKECISSRASRASDVLKAQKLLFQMDEICFAEDGKKNCTIALNPEREQQAQMSPDWIVHRDPFFGLWLYPRLGLVLFACPKCGNSQVRALLNRASEEIQRNEDVDSMVSIKPRGLWARESEHSWQARSSKLQQPDKSHTNALIYEQNLLAYEYVDELLADSEWTSLGIVRHPYERLKSGYSELEFRWQRFVRDPKNWGSQELSSMAVLERGSYWHQPKDTRQRALAFWSEMVLGQFYFDDSASHCLLPIAEAYHLSPVGSFFLRDASRCDPVSMYSPNHVIDIDELHSEWPDFIKHWNGYWNASVASKFAKMANQHSNTKAGSVASKIMTELLATNDAFRHSVDAFYSHDFTTFGFRNGPSILHVDDSASKDPSTCHVLLATYPNSGTTWTQGMFTEATGVFTEALYREGVELPWGTFAHGEWVDDLDKILERAPNDKEGQCHFIKSHAQVGEDTIRSKHYDRAVVLYRNIEDNFAANIRYFNKTEPELKESGSCPIKDWREDDMTAIRQLHHLSHQRYYCHWQNTSIPTLFVLYEKLLAKPRQTFQEIFAYVGYPNANVTLGVQKLPPVSHDTEAPAANDLMFEYQPLDDELCHSDLNGAYNDLAQQFAGRCWMKVVDTLFRRTSGPARFRWI